MKNTKLKFSIMLILLMSSLTIGVTANLEIDTVDDLNQDGVIIAVQSGTTSDLYAQENLVKAEIQGFTSFDAAVAAVEQEDAHVLLGDLPVLAFYAVDNADAGLEVVGSFGDEELFGIGIREDTNEFEDALNAALHTIIEDGTYDAIYSNWFSGDVVLTDDSTAETATTFPTATEGSLLDEILTEGQITFGSDTTYPPFEYIEGGEVIGFDAEIADAIAAAFSAEYSVTVNAVMQTNDWDPIIPDLQAGNFDAILSAMTKTEERDQQIDFTRSYYTSKQGILQGPKDFGHADDDDTEGGLPISIMPFLFAVLAIPVLRKVRN